MSNTTTASITDETTIMPLAWTTKQAAQLCNCHPNTIRRAIRRNELQALDFGNRWLITKDSLEDWLATKSR